MRRGVFIGIGCVLVALAIGATLLITRSHHPARTESKAPARAFATAPSRPAPPLTPARAAALTAGLASGTDHGISAVIALPSTQALDPAAAGQLKALSPITFDVSTFHDAGNGTATVTAHITNPGANKSPTWNVILIDKDGQWLISLTSTTS
jgi:hypothetical protein